MSTASNLPQQPVDPEVIAGQAGHWAGTFSANPDMYGTDPSASGVAAAEIFTAEGFSSVLELGAGQGRDTLYLARPVGTTCTSTAGSSSTSSAGRSSSVLPRGSS